MPDDPQNRPPQPPAQDALNEHKDEGEGPFGSDMTHLLGGTRTPEDHGEPQGNAYNTGTERESGGSVKPSDPRTHFDPGADRGQSEH